MLMGIFALMTSMLCFGLSRTFWGLVARCALLHAMIIYFDAYIVFVLLSASRCLRGLLDGNVGELLYILLSFGYLSNSHEMQVWLKASQAKLRTRRTVLPAFHWYMSSGLLAQVSGLCLRPSFHPKQI